VYAAVLAFVVDHGSGGDLVKVVTQSCDSHPARRKYHVTIPSRSATREIDKGRSAMDSSKAASYLVVVRTAAVVVERSSNAARLS
jgi:hypothetical protein